MKDWVKWLLVSCAFVLNTDISFSQEYNNYVPNPSFEKYFQCPDTIGSIFIVENWFGVCNPYIEAFNTCCTIPMFQIPKNDWGYQMPHSGNGYSQFAMSFLYSFQREYIGCKLLTPLFAGKYYNFEMFVSLAEWSAVSCDQLGMLLTDSNVICPSLLYANLSNYSPQITTSVGIIFQDSINWVKISGSFIAKGNEQYLTLGFFQENDSINWIYRHDYWVNWSEYYIDDIYLYETDKPPMPANAGNDILICRGDSLQLGSTWYLDYRYFWSTDAGIFDTIGQPWVKPGHTTTYYLVQTDFKSVTTYDTVVISVKNCETPAQAGEDAEICKGDSVLLKAGNTEDNKYLWVSCNRDTIIPPALVYPDSSLYFILLQWNKYDSLTFDTMDVTVKDCHPPMVIPNVFTPNGDGKNDVFEILNPGEYSYILNIFNRWGIVVYQDDGTSPWDGKRNGAPMPEGAYFYTILAITPGKTEIKYSGAVHLLR